MTWARLYGWMKSLELLNAQRDHQAGTGRQMPAAESSVMKMATGAGPQRLGSEHGSSPAGAWRDGERRGFWQNQYLLAPCFHIAGGTDEIQKNVAAERVLGLPAEPRTDREVPFESLARA